jgi:hypothetical protein
MDAAAPLPGRLKAAREFAGGITVKKLAALVNKPRFGEKVIGKIDRGERQAEPHEIQWLAEALCIPAAFLTSEQPFADDNTRAADFVEEQLAEMRKAHRHANRSASRPSRRPRGTPGRRAGTPRPNRYPADGGSGAGRSRKASRPDSNSCRRFSATGTRTESDREDQQSSGIQLSACWSPA